MRRFLLVSLLLVACGPTESSDPVDTRDACFLCQADGKGDNLGLSTPEIQGILALVNTASRHQLDVDAQLDRRAANNIVDTRIAIGSFEDLETLDAVSYVGPSALKRLRNYAVDHGFVPDPDVLVHGIPEGSEQAIAILATVNNESFTTLDDEVALDRRAAQNIVDARPIATLTELDAIGYVGKSAFEKLASYSPACSTGETEALIQSINSVSWQSFTREVRTDVPLSESLDSRNWPAEMTHAGCYGIRPDDIPSWIPVTEPEDDTRIHALFNAFASSAERLGTETNVDIALQELSCKTAEREFIGCRFEFQPNPWSGITWNAIESTDGSISYLFVGTWAE